MAGVGSSGAYFIILKNQSDFDAQRLADILSRILKVPRFDVISHLARYWGMLHMAGSLEEAQGLKRQPPIRPQWRGPNRPGQQLSNRAALLRPGPSKT